MPNGRLDQLKSKAESSHDVAAIQRIRQTEWMIADARGFAPDDWPYLARTPLVPGPSEIARDASHAQAAGKTDEAIAILQAGRDRFEFARCDLSTNLAVFITPAVAATMLSPSLGLSSHSSTNRFARMHQVTVPARHALSRARSRGRATRDIHVISRKLQGDHGRRIY